VVGSVAVVVQVEAISYQRSSFHSAGSISGSTYCRSSRRIGEPLHMRVIDISTRIHYVRSLTAVLHYQVRREILYMVDGSYDRLIDARRDVKRRRFFALDFKR